MCYIIVSLLFLSPHWWYSRTCLCAVSFFSLYIPPTKKYIMCWKIIWNYYSEPLSVGGGVYPLTLRGHTKNSGTLYCVVFIISLNREQTCVTSSQVTSIRIHRLYWGSGTSFLSLQLSYMAKKKTRLLPNRMQLFFPVLKGVFWYIQTLIKNSWEINKSRFILHKRSTTFGRVNIEWRAARLIILRTSFDDEVLDWALHYHQTVKRNY